MITVRLISHTPEPEKVIALSARLCYSPLSVDELEDKFTEEKIASFIKKIIDLGHESVLEHVTFSFAVEGISRACSHQLVRHRIASYSQQSQRYVNFENIEYVIPETISNSEKHKKKFRELMSNIADLYKDLLKEGIPAEDARFVLPNAATTKIIVTMNLRELKHFFRLRTCNRAQWEIRALAIEMLKLLKNKIPLLFSQMGPACLNGSCPEGQMSCKKWREVRDFFSKL
jgi:thymidylate synthase (FAD)